jgi:hypothetical protein
MATALAAVLVAYALLLKRVARVRGGLLVATYGMYLALTFR